MKLRAIIAWPSVLGALVKAVRELDFVDLKVWSMKDLEERPEECQKGLSDADVLLFYVGTDSDAWKEAEPALLEMSRTIPTLFIPTEIGRAHV